MKLLNKVCCETCAGVSRIHLNAMTVVKGDLILKGNCVKGGEKVAQVIETSEIRD